MYYFTNLIVSNSKGNENNKYTKNTFKFFINKGTGNMRIVNILATSLLAFQLMTHPTKGTDSTTPIVTHIKTCNIENTIQHHVFDQHKVQTCENELKETFPNATLSDEEVQFSPQVNQCKKVFLVEEGKLIGRKKDGLYYTWNIRECCAVTISNPDLNPVGIMAHLYPCSTEGIKSSINNIFDLCREKCSANFRHKNTRARIVSSFLSQHLYNTALSLEEMGIPVTHIYYHPIVLEFEPVVSLENQEKTNIRISYCPQRYRYEGDRVKKVIKGTNELVKRSFPRRVAFDPVTGEVATQVKLRIGH